MHKKRVGILATFLIIGLFLCSGIAYGVTGTGSGTGSTCTSPGGTFGEMNKMICEVFYLVNNIFTLPLFNSPETSWGFILFCLFALITSVIYLGASRVFGGNQRQAVVVSVVISLITVIFLNFQRELIWNMMGNWVVIVYLSIAYAGLAGIVFVAFRFLPHTGWGDLGRAIVCFFLFFVLTSLSKDLATLQNWLNSGISTYAYGGRTVPLALPASILLSLITKRFHNKKEIR
jgi:hypothetical protein